MNELKALVAQLADIQAQVKAQGGFVADRDLHQCPACGLMEDVLYGGKLVTYWRQSGQPEDTVLRFKEVGVDQLACPCCGGGSLVDVCCCACIASYGRLFVIAGNCCDVVATQSGPWRL